MMLPCFYSLHKKSSFALRISSVDVTKSAIIFLLKKCLMENFIFFVEWLFWKSLYLQLWIRYSRPIWLADIALRERERSPSDKSSTSQKNGVSHKGLLHFLCSVVRYSNCLFLRGHTCVYSSVNMNV